MATFSRGCSLEPLAVGPSRFPTHLRVRSASCSSIVGPGAPSARPNWRISPRTRRSSTHWASNSSPCPSTTSRRPQPSSQNTMFSSRSATEQTRTPLLRRSAPLQRQPPPFAADCLHPHAEPRDSRRRLFDERHRAPCGQGPHRLRQLREVPPRHPGCLEQRAGYAGFYRGA